MALQRTQVKTSHQELKALRAELETVIDGLRQQLRAVEDERDRARQGLDVLTEALRRRGCCDHDVGEASL